MSTLMVFQIMSFREGKNLFLVIQLLSEFDFGHATLKPFIFDHSAVLKGGFADVDDMWQWDTHVIPFSLFSLISVFLLSLLSPSDEQGPGVGA